MKNRKRREYEAARVRELRHRRHLGRAMRSRACYVLCLNGRQVAVFAREDDLLDFVAELRDACNNLTGLMACRLDAYARDALCFSAGYIVVRNESAIASFKTEDDALLFEGMLAEKDELGAQRSVRGEVIDASGSCRARYSVGPKTHGRYAWVA